MCVCVLARVCMRERERERFVFQSQKGVQTMLAPSTEKNRNAMPVHLSSLKEVLFYGFFIEGLWMGIWNPKSLSIKVLFFFLFLFLFLFYVCGWGAIGFGVLIFSFSSNILFTLFNLIFLIQWIFSLTRKGFKSIATCRCYLLCLVWMETIFLGFPLLLLIEMNHCLTPISHIFRLCKMEILLKGRTGFLILNHYSSFSAMKMCLLIWRL